MVQFENGNIAGFLPHSAWERPYAAAIIEPRWRFFDGCYCYRHLTYAQLDAETDMIAHGLKGIGLRQGDRCALMVKPSLHFFSLMFAMFKAGIVPVLIDPGIGLGALKTCIEEASPRGFIGIPLARFARFLFGWARRSIEITVTVGPRRTVNGVTLFQVREQGRNKGPFPIHEPREGELAAIIFTSGSTGMPKGVTYTHQNFINQVVMIRDIFDIQPGEIDVPTFPPFALFDPALGMTAVIPDMDARFPAKARPENIYQAIEDFGATNMFCSPALLNTLSRDGQTSRKKLPTLRRVLSAGAPAQPDVLERMASMLDDEVEIFTPYGATECMPVCMIGSREVLASREKTDRGEGICVGKPVPGMFLSIIRLTDEALPVFEENLVLKRGDIGEIVVRGPVVTGSYIEREEATRKAKMHDSEGRLYHRMGDVGYLDQKGRLWFCGRKNHRVQTADDLLFTIPSEAVFNTHPHVFRSALVGVETADSVRPVICIELEPDHSDVDWDNLVADLRSIGARYAHTKTIHDFLLHPEFPVDTRHNAKIRREYLAVWARKRLS